MSSPNNPDIEKRLLLAIVLSMAILFAMPYVYRAFFPSLIPEPPLEEVSPGAAEPDSESAEDTGLLEQEGAAEPQQAAPQAPEEDISEESSPTQAEPSQFEVESDDLILGFSNRGAVLERIALRNYLTDEGKPLELIPQGIGESFPRPLVQKVPADEELSNRLAAAIYEVQLDEGSDPWAAELVFRFRDLDLESEKRFQIPRTGYGIHGTSHLRINDQRRGHALVLGTGIGVPARSDLEDFIYPAVVYYQNGSVERYYEDDLEEGSVQLELNPSWAGIDSKYFTYLILNPNGIQGLKMNRLLWSGSSPETDADIPLLSVDVRMAGDSDFTFFAGPKDEEVLTQVEPSLEQIIDYGWFGVLVKPLISALKFINQFVHNYGWSILILTFLINLALFPVRYKQIVSMRRMSELQPKLKSIQDKYKRMKKDDPRRQQMNTEVMALYREEGVNPLGGCLPLLIQMPILFAFYRMLYSSIELRDAPFVLWIEDLSKPDPYYVTPIVMGLTMVAQQRMTPSVGDPAQRRMMMMLPIVFTFFFLNVSSGLALYFLFSNVFAMMFQLLLQRWRPELSPSPSTGKQTRKKKASK